MQSISSSGLRRIKRATSSFTLIELLVVMTIIAILAAMTLFAAEGALNAAARNKARAEIQTMSTALEGYKTDNGVYPVAALPGSGSRASILGGAPYSTLDPSTLGGSYQISSKALYQALSGQTNFTDIPVVGVKSYMSFKKNQVGDPTGSLTGGSYIQDPWNYSYGYATGVPSSPPTANDPAPYNGAG